MVRSCCESIWETQPLWQQCGLPGVRWQNSLLLLTHSMSTEFASAGTGYLDGSACHGNEV